MPRGGRRPGAGAPKGNFNAMRSGKYSKRLLLVLAASKVCLDKRAVFIELYEQGFYPPPSYEFNGDYKGLVRYLYAKWFDSSASKRSNTIRKAILPPLPGRLPGSLPRPNPTEKPDHEKIARNNDNHPLTMTPPEGVGGEVAIILP